MLVRTPKGEIPRTGRAIDPLHCRKRRWSKPRRRSWRTTQSRRRTGAKSVLEDKEKFGEHPADEKLKHMGDKPAGGQTKPEEKSK
jgi:hypothetical protein